MYVCMYMFKCFLLRRCSDQKKKKKKGNTSVNRAFICILEYSISN